MQRDLLTAEALAEQLGVRPSTVRNWARQGRIPRVRITPKVVRFERNDVLDALRRAAIAQEGHHVG